MKLYLSSFHLGSKPNELLDLLGKNRLAGVIVNAIDDAPQDIRDEKLEVELKDLRNLGIDTSELDLRKYFGKKKKLRDKLSEYGMLWVRGGNTFILRRAYAYSGLDEWLKEKTEDYNFVYAGYSAGVCVLAPSLKGLDIVDNPNIFPDGYKQEIIWEGLGVIDYSIAPHYRSDHPESEMVEKEVEYMKKNNIAFRALRDGEVIITEID